MRMLEMVVGMAGRIRDMRRMIKSPIIGNVDTIASCAGCRVKIREAAKRRRLGFSR